MTVYSKQAFLNVDQRNIALEEQALYEIEEAKNSILNDVHLLAGRIGAPQTKAWLLANFIDLAF
jgi:hypothetical protein